ncbi:MAG: histidine kinase [Chitinophagaceae bacterium]
MKYIFTLFFITSSCFNSFSQDNLYNPKDSNLLNKIIDSLDKNYKDESYEKLLEIGMKARRFLKNSNNLHYANILKQEGFHGVTYGDYSIATLKLDSAITIYDAYNDTFNAVKLLNTKGISLMYSGSYLQALQSLFVALSKSKLLKNIKLQSQILNNISLVYQSIKDYEAAISFSKESLKLKLVLKDSQAVISNYANIANFYFDKKMYDSSLSNNRSLLKLLDTYQSESDLADTYLAIGNCFFYTNKLDSAVYYFEKSHKKISTNTAEQNKANIILSLLTGYLKTNQINKIAPLKSKLVISSKEIADPAYQRDYHYFFYQYNRKINNISASLNELELYKQFNDTIEANANNIEHQKIAIKYELGKKLVADSLQAEQKILIANGKTIQTRNSLLIVALLLVIALATAIILYNRSKLFKKKAIIAEQEKQIEAQQKIAYQLKTLQAQMNPHFVFNCFNTIDSFILQNKQYEASLLVQRFSKLSRKILEQTSLNNISFEEELETLNTYLQIEKLRANNSFDFGIEKDEATLSYQLPPMLLQPFVENAVVHGVRALQNKDGFIKITVRNNVDFITIYIEDNGVGRKKAAEIKEHNTSTHRSMSMDLTLQRLKALHQNASIENYLQFTDFDNNKTGTLVTIKIPKVVNE